MIRRLLLGGALWALLAPVAFAHLLKAGAGAGGSSFRTFYIDAAAVGAGNGLSPASAWDIAQLNTGPVGGYQATDRILFTGTFTGATGVSLSPTQWATGPSAPSTAAPVTFSTYGAGATLQFAAAVPCILTSGIGGIVITGPNLTCTGRGIAADAVDGIRIANTAGTTMLPAVTINNVTVSAFGGSGIFILGSTTGGQTNGFNPVTITGNVVHDNSGVLMTYTHTAGIETYSSGAVGLYATTPAFPSVTVTGNTAYNNSGVASAGNWSGSGIVVLEAGTVVLGGSSGNGNVAYLNGANNTNSAGPVGIWSADSNNVTISYNESYSNETNSGSGGGDGAGLDCDGGIGSCLIEHNYVHDNAGSGIQIVSFSGAPNTNTVVRDNISANNATGTSSNAGEMYVTQSSAALTGAQVYNNTFCGAAPGSTPHPVLSIVGTPTAQISNNIFCTGADNVDLVYAANNPTGASLTGNNYYTPLGKFNASWNGTAYTTFASYKSGTSQEATNNLTDPTVSPLLAWAGYDGTIGGYAPPAPTAYSLLAASPVSGGVGLNLNSLYGINPGTRDFYGNTVSNTTLPVGAFGGAAAGCPYQNTGQMLGGGPGMTSVWAVAGTQTGQAFANGATTDSCGGSAGSQLTDGNGNSGTVAVGQTGLTFTAGTTYTCTVLIKTGVGTARHLSMYVANAGFTSSVRTWFDPATGLTTVNNSNITWPAATTVGEQYGTTGWYRVGMTFTPSGSNGTAIYLYVGTTADSTTFTGSGSSMYYYAPVCRTGAWP